MLVTGAGGMVGSYVPDTLPDYDLTLTDINGTHANLDVREPEDVMKAVKDVKPDVVLHLAAATDVDQCEKDPDWAYHSNAIGTQNVALACREVGCVLVYISTAGVFWGDKPEPYNEFDVPRAANVYGDSKWQGEKIVTSLLDRFYICRAGWMIGGGAKDKKFVGFMTRKMLEGEKKLKAVADKFGSPTYARHLLQTAHRLLDTGYYGLYHTTNNGTCSRHDVALAIRDLLGKDDVEITPVNSAHFPLPAPRARSEMMRNYKLEMLGLNKAPSWRKALEEYVLGELVPALS
jgi:dTDP-4-dehydrorhamnose reductase